ncbi:MAG: TIGR01620 family protein [Stappiaceae bacterium]
MNKNKSKTGQSDTPASRRPAAFRLDDRDVILATGVSDNQTSGGGKTTVVPAIEPALEGDPAAETIAPVSNGLRWGRFLWIGLGGLVSLAFGLAIDQLIRDLFARTDWLGWAGLGLVGLAGIGLVGLIIRELYGLARLAKIDRLRGKFEVAAEKDDAGAAKGAIRELTSLYQDRPETAKGRAALAAHEGEIIDGRDLVSLAERDLLLPLDAKARRLVLESAKRVSVVTAVSPRAIVDLLFVLVSNLRLLRQLSALYGGRPGTLGFIRLLRQVITHLAITGGMAAGDSLLQQFLGQGLAARLSARLGEGVVNGLLTSRVGLSAIDVCRPCPFIGTSPPRLSDFMSELMRSSEQIEDSSKAPSARKK